MNDSQIKEVIRTSVSKGIDICGTQNNFAKKAGISQAAIGKYLRGDARPSGVTAKNLSKAVDGQLSPADFAPHIF